jgi:UPF0716 protein FxsA
MAVNMIRFFGLALLKQVPIFLGLIQGALEATVFFVLLFFAVPLFELMLLIEVGGAIGGWETIGLCLLTAMVGGSLARRQGIGVLTRMRASVHHGQLPATELIDSVFIVVAGLLLMTPGFLTDAVGLFFLTPLTRALIRPAVLRRVQGAGTQSFRGGFGGAGGYSQTYGAGESSESDFHGDWKEPEFLPPGEVTTPPRRDEPPEIIID